MESKTKTIIFVNWSCVIRHNLKKLLLYACVIDNVIFVIWKFLSDQFFCHINRIIKSLIYNSSLRHIINRWNFSLFVFFYRNFKISTSFSYFKCFNWTRYFFVFLLQQILWKLKLFEKHLLISFLKFLFVRHIFISVMSCYNSTSFIMTVMQNYEKRFRIEKHFFKDLYSV